MSLSLIFGSLFVGTYLLSSISTVVPRHTQVATVSASATPVYLATPRAVPAPLPVALATPVPTPRPRTEPTVAVVQQAPEQQQPPHAYPGKLGLSTPQPVPVNVYVQPTGLRYLRIQLFRVVKVFVITTLILAILLLVPFGVRYLLTDSINSLEEIRDRLALAATAAEAEQEEVAAATETVEAPTEHAATDAEEVAAEALLTLRNNLVDPSPVVKRRRQRSAAPLRNIKPDQD